MGLGDGTHRKTRTMQGNFKNVWCRIKESNKAYPNILLNLNKDYKRLAKQKSMKIRSLGWQRCVRRNLFDGQWLPIDCDPKSGPNVQNMCGYPPPIRAICFSLRRPFLDLRYGAL